MNDVSSLNMSYPYHFKFEEKWDNWYELEAIPTVYHRATSHTWEIKTNVDEYIEKAKMQGVNESREKFRLSSCIT